MPGLSLFTHMHIVQSCSHQKHCQVVGASKMEKSKFYTLCVCCHFGGVAQFYEKCEFRLIDTSNYTQSSISRGQTLCQDFG